MTAGDPNSELEMEIQRELNEYLFLEFGIEADASRIASDWPFRLEYLGTLDLPGRRTRLFRFSAGEEEFYAVANGALDFMPVAGMDLDDLRRQELGRGWIGKQNPIDLDTTQIGDPHVPSTRERRAAIMALAKVALGAELHQPYTILEGLFLRESGRYLALIGAPSKEQAAVVGTGLPVRYIGFGEATRARCLSAAIGELIEAGEIEP
jgi:hypothetical protein